MRRVIISKTGGVLTGTTGTGYKAPSQAALTVATPASFREFNDGNRLRRSEPRSFLAIAESRAVYGRPIDGKARARAEKRETKRQEEEARRAANLKWARETPILSESEALAIVRMVREQEAKAAAEAQAKARRDAELEARLIAEERAEEMAEAKAKRLEFVRARQSALAGLNKVG